MRLRRSAVLLAVVPLLGLAACGDDSGSSDAASDEGCTWTETGGAAKQVDPPADDAEPADSVVITINGQDVPVELSAEAVCAATSFTSLAEQGYFDDAPCSRVSDPAAVPYGIIQCGDPTGTGTGGPGYSFADELTGEEAYPAGSVAMANSGPDTNGSQFFLNFADSQFPPDYTVLGTISPEGVAALEDVASVGAEGGVPDGPPAQPIVVEQVRPVE